MTPDQLFKARHLLGWSITQVASASKTYYLAVSTYERFGRIIRERGGALPTTRVTAIQAALEAAGAEFTNGDAPSVLLRSTSEKTGQ